MFLGFVGLMVLVALTTSDTTQEPATTPAEEMEQRVAEVVGFTGQEDGWWLHPAKGGCKVLVLTDPVKIEQFRQDGLYVMTGSKPAPGLHFENPPAEPGEVDHPCDLKVAEAFLTSEEWGL